MPAPTALEASPSVAYRRDIDGLRALAVLPVLFYHVRLWPFSGGFIGVDIFFVISGYLIASIIARELAEGRFSLTDFYVRRIRRIFPALFATIAVTIIAGSQILLPLDYRALGLSAAATVLFASNLHFARHSGYFGSAAEEAPLLHTWSLAVEEQFYILFPLLMLCAFRAGGRTRLLLGVAALLSFATALLLVDRAPVLAFYLPFPRAWELLAGALLATDMLPPLRNRWAAQLCALAGVASIGWALFGFSSATAFPGLNALYPVLGALLILHAGQSGSRSAICWAARCPWRSAASPIRSICGTGRLSSSGPIARTATGGCGSSCSSSCSHSSSPLSPGASSRSRSAGPVASRQAAPSRSPAR
ncbi:acyltransferase family protein [Sphingobium fuliginis]|uniref:acyltransferase family protein n=1 Tax=Sphingobium fuliginis (strain ATCC 27551) TaxID=336203 RepID=UPI000414A547|nr:acyltransferase [Sphingobium fuliginis]